jgi:hypothetical protein
MMTLRAGQRHLSIPGIGVTTSRRAVQSAAAADWWAVAGKTCVAAYQPKGAASLAASKINLANPGTYDATEGVSPIFDAAGWTGTGTQWLDTGITQTSVSWTFLVSFSGFTGGGDGRMGSLMWIAPHWFGGDDTWYSNGYVQSSPGSQSGVMGIARADCYRNGILCGAGIDTAVFRKFIILGVDNGSGGVQSLVSAGSVASYVVYSDVLTAGEVATVSAAMAAL